MRGLRITFASFVATFILSVSGVTSNVNETDQVTRYITLDDLVPQIRLSSRREPLQYQEYVFKLTDQLISEDKRPYRISLYLVQQNTYGDLVIYKTDVNGTSTKITWKKDVENVEIDGATEIRIPILPSNKFPTILVTLYFESNFSCPDNNYFTCMNQDECYRSDEDGDRINSQQSAKYRCISKDLQNNGLPNCGTLSACDNDYDNYDNYGDGEKIGWFDVQYLLTILLAGLFFILSPICIVIFLFYHRRMNAARNVQIERQRAVQVQGGRQEAGSAGGYTISPRNDMPPSYDDVHDIKSPPPSFDSVLVLSDSRPLESGSSTATTTTRSNPSTVETQ